MILRNVKINRSVVYALAMKSPKWTSFPVPEFSAQANCHCRNTRPGRFDDRRRGTTCHSYDYNSTRCRHWRELSRNFRQQRRTFVTIPLPDVKKILEAKRFIAEITGYIIKYREDIKRCYRYFGTGHRQYECKGPD